MNRMNKNNKWEQGNLEILLDDFIKSKIRFLEKTGKDIQLPFYSSYERKKIH